MGGVASCNPWVHWCCCLLSIPGCSGVTVCCVWLGRAINHLDRSLTTTIYEAGGHKTSPLFSAHRTATAPQQHHRTGQRTSYNSSGRKQISEKPTLAMVTSLVMGTNWGQVSYLESAPLYPGDWETFTAVWMHDMWQGHCQRLRKLLNDEIMGQLWTNSSLDWRSSDVKVSGDACGTIYLETNHDHCVGVPISRLLTLG